VLRFPIDIEGARTVLMVSLSSMPKRFEAGVSNDINRREALIGPANVATKWQLKRKADTC